jgi:DNA invertase Pin-like site-specific DNA recombinase
MENVYGYVRVSTRSQNYDGQVEMIKQFCKMKDYNLMKIFADKASGKNTDRAEYQEMLDALDKNPQSITVVIVTKIDRVGRNIRDLLKFVDTLGSSQIGFVAIQNNIDTTTKEGRMFLYFMGALSEYERELILERTEAGRRRYLENGGKLGKPQLKLPMDEIKRLAQEGVPKTEIARRLRITTPTVYKRLHEMGFIFKKVGKKVP